MMLSMIQSKRKNRDHHQRRLLAYHVLKTGDGKSFVNQHDFAIASENPLTGFQITDYNECMGYQAIRPHPA